MRRRLLPLIGLCLPLAAQASGGPLPMELVDQIQALEKARDWRGLDALCESLPPKQQEAVALRWVDALFKSERFDRVVEVVDAYLPNLNGKDARLGPLRLQKARSLSRLGRHGAAGAAWETVGFGPFLENAASEFRNAQAWADLERVARRLVDQKAQLPEAQTTAKGLLGEAVARQDRFEEAEPLLRAATEGGSKEPFVWSNLARCLNARKAWEPALQACDKALELDGRVLEARYNRGRAAFELGRYPEAVSDFQAALALDPENPTLKENLRQAQRYASTKNKANKNKK